MQMKWWGWGAEDRAPDVGNMPKFIPYVRQLLGCDTNLRKPIISFNDICMPPLIKNASFMQQMQRHFKDDQIRDDKQTRLLHTYGKSYRDLARIRRGMVTRAPDWVIFPENQEDICFLVQSAVQHNVALIPFGGGTNIVGAFESPAHDVRMIVSVDMCRMNKVLTIDPISQTATIQAGAFGPDIEKQLNDQGFSLGHFPDSFEFSTLGGWLATRSVGMQSDQYGTISDMTLAISCVTPAGVIKLTPYPNASMGPDLNQMILGSEGRIGIITEAVMSVHPLPDTQAFGAVLFPNFSAGIEAIRECATKNMLPHMIRLLDVDETQLSFHFKPKKKRFKRILDALAKKTIGIIHRIDFEQCCVGILAFEGTRQQIRTQRQQVIKLCKKQGAVFLGKGPGKEWYRRKYDYPYLRDLMMDLGCVVDVAETSVLWKDVETFYHKIKTVGYAAMEQCIPKKTLDTLKKPGYLGCHLSHHYQNGTCLYFTFAFLSDADEELQQYDRVKSAITTAIVAHQGSLSHHHGVGTEHSKWLQQTVGQVGFDWLNKIKETIDPHDNLNPKDLTIKAIEPYHSSYTCDIS